MIDGHLAPEPDGGRITAAGRWTSQTSTCLAPVFALCALVAGCSEAHDGFPRLLTVDDDGTTTTLYQFQLDGPSRVVAGFPTEESSPGPQITPGSDRLALVSVSISATLSGMPSISVRTYLVDVTTDLTLDVTSAVSEVDDGLCDESIPDYFIRVNEDGVLVRCTHSDLVGGMPVLTEVATFVVDRAGTARRVGTDNVWHSLELPDGRLYASVGPTLDTLSHVLLDIDSGATQPVELMADEDVYAYDPSRASLVVVTRQSDPSGAVSSVRLVPVDGSAPTDLASFDAPTFFDGVTDDGAMLFVETDAAGAVIERARIFEPSGESTDTALESCAPVVGVVHPAPLWSPDGSRFHVTCDTGEWVVARDGSAHRITTATSDRASWSPDGSTILTGDFTGLPAWSLLVPSTDEVRAVASPEGVARTLDVRWAPRLSAEP